MKDKYYTPSKEEFHIGFEFEYSHGNMKENKWEWIKTTADGTTPDWECIEVDNEEFMRNNYRVKALNYDDIMDLGWQKNNLLKNKDIGMSFQKGDWFLVAWLGEIMHIEIQRDEHDVSYAMECKNKSVLKQIMKQLKINP